jgi:hypothetical protein
MSVTKSGNIAHDNACNLSEGTRQSAVAAATGNQATIRTLEIAHYRGCLASAIANNCQPGAFIRALQDLRADGV